MLRRAVRLALPLLAMWIAGAQALALEVGDKAPPLEGVKWLNNKVPIDWRDFDGRALFIERWATW